jgi:macrolide transport system ATP-binding/permease protein
MDPNRGSGDGSHALELNRNNPMTAWIRSRLRNLFRSSSERSLDEELESCLEILIKEKMDMGMTLEEARRHARLETGGLNHLREQVRDVRWRGGWARRSLNAFFYDVRFATRTLRKRPGFTAAALLSVGLGLGANLAVFRFVDAVLLKSLAVPSPHQLVILRGGRGFGYPWFRELASRNDVFANTAARWTVRVNLTAEDRTEYMPAEIVSGTYFDTLGVRPALGRLLNTDDDGAEGAHAVCVISYGFWQRRLGGDPTVVGRSVILNTQPFQIVGVTERGFTGAELQVPYDLQVPMSMIALLGGNPRDSWSWTGIQVFGRLKPGLSREIAEPRVAAIGHQIDLDHKIPRQPNRPYTLAEGRQGLGSIRAQLGDPVLIAMLLSGLVLLLTCANLANLLLARTSERRHEIAVRRSLGASRGRLASQMLVESLVLATSGGLIALGIAAVLDRTLSAMLFGPMNRMHVEAAPSPLGLAVASALTMFMAIAIGVLPALAATRQAPLDGLHETSRTGGQRTRSSRALVVIQIAICLVLLFGAGLFARSLRHLRTIDLGLDPDHVVVLTMNPGRSGYSKTQAADFFDTVLRRARFVPGVQSAGLAGITALSGGMFAGWIRVPGSAADPDHFNNNFNAISPEYPRTVGLSLVAGRAFTDGDDAGAPPVVIVNQRFVDYYWPGQSPMGRHVTMLGKDVEIVGLVRTAKYQTVREDPQITIYFPIAQRSMSEITLHVRTDTDPARTAEALATMIRAIDPRMPVYNVATLEDHVNAGLSNERVLNLLAALFAALAIVVSAVGLYGLVAQSVARRTREVGIRLAVGAQSSDVMRLFVLDTIVLVLIGIAVGAPMALGVARYFGAILYGLAPSDPLTLAVAAAGLGAVALLAVALPARRATKVDPIDALRAH